MRLDEFELKTKRLLLRPHRIADAAFMVKLNSDPEVVRYTGDGALSGPAEAKKIIASLRRQFRERKIGRFIVIERKTGRPIGWCGLKHLAEKDVIDLGYRFLKEAWGQGFASEAAAAGLKYGFEKLGFERITAYADAENAASLHVLRKLGMKPCGAWVERGRKCLRFEISPS